MSLATIDAASRNSAQILLTLAIQGHLVWVDDQYLGCLGVFWGWSAAIEFGNLMLVSRSGYMIRGVDRYKHIFLRNNDSFDWAGNGDQIEFHLLNLIALALIESIAMASSF